MANSVSRILEARAIHVLLLIAIASATEVNVIAEESGFDASVEFIDQKLIGKTFLSMSKRPLDKGKLESEFQRKTLYTNLMRSTNTATFDQVSLIRQTLWELDGKGNRKLEKQTIKDRVVVSRVNLYRSLATDEALGTLELLTNSAVSPIGQGAEVSLRKDGEELVINYQNSFYYDGFKAGGGFRPIASSVEERFSEVEGKIEIASSVTLYEVDPQKLTREKADEPFLSKDIQIKSLWD